MASPIAPALAGLPRGYIGAIAVLGAGGVFTSNPLLTVASFAALFAMFVLLWRPAEPPVMFYAMAYQWLQATILIFSADLQGLALNDIDLRPISLQARPGNVDLEAATWLTLIGLLGVAAGMRLAAGRPTGMKMLGTLNATTAAISPYRAAVACLASMVAAAVVQTVGSIVPGLSQPMLALANVHWVFVYIFAYVVLTQRRGYAALALIFCFELGIGLMGFFSEFKTVLIVVLMAALSIPSALTGRRLWVAGVTVALMVAFGVVWSAIKVEYRDFMNQGTRDQAVLVSKSAQVEELRRLIGDLTPERLSFGAFSLVNRLTYVYFFSETMQMVPNFIPYEEGALWGDAVYRALVPRLLDPSKTAIDDSERTTEYTGLQILGSDQGTSVSLGYVAESYIDFGPLFMVVPLCLWGALIGYAYKTFTRPQAHALFGYGCITITVIIGASVLEQSNAKMVAGMMVLWLVTYLTRRYGAPSIMRALAYRTSRPLQAATDSIGSRFDR